MQGWVVLIEGMRNRIGPYRRSPFRFVSGCLRPVTVASVVATALALPMHAFADGSLPPVPGVDQQTMSALNTAVQAGPVVGAPTTSTVPATVPGPVAAAPTATGPTPSSDATPSPPDVSAVMAVPAAASGAGSSGGGVTATDPTISPVVPTISPPPPAPPASGAPQADEAPAPDPAPAPTSTPAPFVPP